MDRPLRLGSRIQLEANAEGGSFPCVVEKYQLSSDNSL